jgi:hypothetical protein
MKKPPLLCFAAFAFFLLLSFSLKAQEGGDEAEAYIITEVSFQLDGRTQGHILEKKLEIKKGARFASRKALEAYLLDREEALRSHRVLETGSVTYITGEIGEGGRAVHVFVVAQDTWNIIGLPNLKYDSNKGFFAGFRFRDNNFFGSMEPLRLDLDYIIGEASNGFKQEMQFVIPFRLFEHVWRLRSLEKAEYLTQGGGWKINAETGLAVDFPYNEQIWTLEYVQGFYYRDKDFYDDHFYHSSKLLFGSDFTLPVDMGWFGGLKYRPDVFTRLKYRPGRDLSTERRGVEPGLSHKIFVSRVDWKENFREGAHLSVGSEHAWNLNEERAKQMLEWAFIGHKALSFMGVSGRLSGFYQFFKERGPEDDNEVGKSIRGILDDRLRGEAAIFVNIDLPVKMWVWFLEPYIEVQAGPFFDLALVRRRDRAFSREGLYYSAGLEVVGFPKFLSRSIYVRASLGLDLEAFSRDHKLRGEVPEKDMDAPPIDDKPWKRLEAFIGFGHHY